MRSFTKALGALALVLMMTLLAACGSDNSSSSGSAPQTDASGKTVVHVFGWGFETIQALPQVPKQTWMEDEVKTAAAAIAKDPNAKVSIDYTFCDTQNTQNGALACARKATSSNGCDGSKCDVALLISDQVDAVTVPTISKAGIPIVAVSTQTSVANSDPNTYCITGGLAPQLEGVGYTLKKQGASDIGLIAFESPVAADYLKWMKSGAQAQGLTVNKATTMPLTAGNPGPVVDTVLGDKADGLAPVSAANIPAQIKYAQSTYPGIKLALPGIVVSPFALTGLTTAQTDGIGISAASQPTSASTIPGVAQYVKEGGKQAEGAYPNYDDDVMTWLATHFIANVAGSASGSMSASTMAKALKSAKNIDMGGIMPPWSADQRGKNGAEPCSPYNVFVPETLKGGVQVADEPGVFRDPLSGKVVYTNPGATAPAN